jgi:hypothetical protein
MVGGVIMYYYILDKHNKKVFEFNTENNFDYRPVFTSMGIKFYDEFPYEYAGYDDPYVFLSDYTLIKFKDNQEIIEVEE